MYWGFKNIYGERLDRLNNAPPFKEIVEKINEEMKVVCCHWIEAQDDPIDYIFEPPFHRIVFCVEVSEDLFDIFFNSKNGYRAQYFISPEQGLIENCKLIKTVTPKLMEEMQNISDCKGIDDWARKSLEEESAKAWRLEIGKELCTNCKIDSEDAKSEIRNNRWEIFNHTNAEKGVKAHYFNKIRFFGGFLNKKFQPWVDKKKWCRHWEIHKWGFS